MNPESGTRVPGTDDPGLRQPVQLDYLDSDGESSDPECGAPWLFAAPGEGNLTSSLPAGPLPFVEPVEGGPVHRVESATHFPCFDLDFECRLVPSRSVGHWHLYLDQAVPADLYWKLLDVMAECGLVEPGWVRSGKARGFTSVRREGTFAPHSTTRDELAAARRAEELAATLNERLNHAP